MKIIFLLLLFERSVMGLRVDAMGFWSSQLVGEVHDYFTHNKQFEKRFIIHHSAYSWTIEQLNMFSFVVFSWSFIPSKCFLLILFFFFRLFLVFFWFIVIFCSSCCCFRFCVCYISSSIYGDKPPSSQPSIHPCGPFSIRIMYILHILAGLYCANYMQIE